MAKTKVQKGDLIKFYKDKLEGSKGMYVIDAQGMTSNDANRIKQELYDLNSHYHVVKNRLFHIALTELGYTVADEIKAGEQAVIFANEETVTQAAKVIKEYIKENENIQIRLGMLDGKYISVQQIKELAELPSKEDMIAHVLRTMNAPLTGLVTVLSGNARGLVNVLNAIKEKKQ